MDKKTYIELHFGSILVRQNRFFFCCQIPANILICFLEGHSLDLEIKLARYNILMENRLCALIVLDWINFSLTFFSLLQSILIHF